MNSLFRTQLYCIYDNRKKLLNAKNDAILDQVKRKNLSRRMAIEDEFEAAIKEEIAKLESKMKIGRSTLRLVCSIQ